MALNNKMTYVFSGAAHARITLNSILEKQNKALVADVIAKAEKLFKNHKFTCLYNAFTEAENGKRMLQASILQNPMHADSGGLQIITRGLSITPELKDKVYKNQLYAGVAMCFDEIPLETVGGKSKIGDTSNRIFREDWIEAKAKETAENIVRQAVIFEKHKADTKIMAIVQGNCYDTYMKWIDVLVKNIPSDIYHHIEGMSFAGTSSGSGQVEDIERIFSFTQAQAPTEFTRALHLLGVGSVSRHLPLVGFIRGGHFDDVHISYDSTSHSQRISNREYMDENNKSLPCRQHNHKNIRRLYDYCQKYFGILADYDRFFDTITYNREYSLNKYGESTIHIWHEAMIAAAMVSVIHATWQLDKVCVSDKEFEKLLTYNKAMPMKYLKDVKNREDFDAFMRQFGPYLNSQKIRKHTEISTLSAFF